MSHSLKKTFFILSSMAISLVVIFLIEASLRHQLHASLLWNLLFWTALVEGSIALVAIADLARANWIAPIREEILSLYLLLPLLCLLFVFSSMQWKLYPWMESQGVWLNTWFFLVRNIASLLLCFLFAWAFAAASRRNTENKKLFATLYLFSFVICQSLVAFDWVMSMEYPWISTLFGGYFIVESVYAGIALSGILYVLLCFHSSERKRIHSKQTLRDVATLMFGFSLFWVGLLYAQFLVIWYGNIPEETGFLLKRIIFSPFRELSFLVLLTLFFIPFLIFLSRKAKSTSPVVLVISLLIMAGLIIERALFLAAISVLKGTAAPIEFMLIGFPFMMLLLRKKEGC